MEMLFLFLILNSNSMINESGFMPDFLFSVNRYYDIIETKWFVFYNIIVIGEMYV